MNGHILPSSNAQYDLGSAEYKIRHLFLSDNSLWVGDSHKISIRNGQMKLRKRKNSAPTNLIEGSNTIHNAILAERGGDIGNFTLHDWQKIALDRGMTREAVDGLFDADEDFDDENDNFGISAGNSVKIHSDGANDGNYSIFGSDGIKGITRDNVKLDLGINSIINQISKVDVSLNDLSQNYYTNIVLKAPINAPNFTTSAQLDGNDLATKEYVDVSLNDLSQNYYTNIALKAPINNPVFTGTPKLNTKELATKEYVDISLNDLSQNYYTNIALKQNILTPGPGLTIVNDVINLEQNSQEGAYEPDITENSDISLNNLKVHDELKVDTINEITNSFGVTIENVLLKDQNITAHTISAQNYAVGGTNFVSASRQGNFRDLEIKSGSNQVTFLAEGDTGDLSMNGTLKVDTITNSSGVTINSVLLQNQNITAHTISAQNYAVGGTNFVSASRQGNFRDLEIKSGSNQVTFLAEGNTGDLSINGTFNVDTINEKTNSSGVTIENILLKDGDISGNDASFNNIEANAIILNNVDLTSTLTGKQDKLTAGTGINIATNGTISYSGGGINKLEERIISVSVHSKTSNHPRYEEGSNNSYFFNGIEAPILELVPGITYKFDLSHSSVNIHPIRFQTQEITNSNYEYKDGVVKHNLDNIGQASSNVESYIKITVTKNTPRKLYYVCNHHNYMGNSIYVSASNNFSGIDSSFNTIDVSNIILRGDIVPDIPNVYSLGSPTHPIKELYLSGNSLYVDGTKLVETQEQTINIYGDDGQHVNLGTRGTGVLQLTSENDAQITTTGNGDIELSCKGTGTIELQSNVEVTGNIIPNSNNSYSLGSSVNKFSGVYSQIGTFNTITLNGTDLATTISNSVGQPGSQGDQGPQGVQGVQGPRGEAFQVDEFNVVLNNAKINQLMNGNGSSTDFYVFVVSEDTTRTVGLNGIDTVGNLTNLARHVIAYNGTTFTDYGPFTGLKGDTGEQGEPGDKGDTGATGPRGEAFQVDEFNVSLDDNKVDDIKNQSASTTDFYVFVVSTDSRTTGLSGVDTVGNLTNLERHVVAYNGITFADYGPFTGLKGDTGEQGVAGSGGTTIDKNTDISLNDLDVYGVLQVDTINEKTNSSGVTIESVLLKNGDISGNDASFNNIEANTIILNNVDLTTTLAPINNPKFTGNVAIGSDNTDHKLYIKADSGYSTVYIEGDNTQLYLGANNGSNYISFTNNLLFYSSETQGNPMAIGSNGYVGIGTNSPSTELDVVGDISCSSLTVAGVSITQNGGNGGGGGASSFIELTETPSSLGSAGQILAVADDGNNGKKLEFINNTGGGGGGGGGGSGNGIDISGGSSSSDISMNFTGTRNEGDIVYDSSRNIFLEASRSKDDNNSLYTQDEIDFKPLGYSFFRENLEGQPPSPSISFFDITPSSITINWSNPRQYPSALTNLNDLYNNTTNGELSTAVNSYGNIYFPIVNRIMIQIKNLEKGSYEKWGGKLSPISQNVVGLEGGYVICSKNHPIPPMLTEVSPSFGDTHESIGRDSKVYELIDMANSIVLYSAGNTPSNSVIETNINSNPKRVSAINGESTKEINPSNAGYEIKVWLENQYASSGMTENDFNVMTLTKDNNNDILNFQTVSPPSKSISFDLNLAFNDLELKDSNNNDINVVNGNTVIELIVKDPKQTTSSGDFNSSINLVGVKLEYANTDTNTPDDSDWTDVKKIYFKDTTQITSSGSLGSLTTITDGIHNINRLNDHGTIAATDTTTKYYYYIKLNSEFLDASNNEFKQHHSFRISYKNASNDNFGTTTISNVVSVKEPQKPSIESVKMTSHNTITINMNTYGIDKEDFILGETTDININKNYAVFLREAMFKVMYKYGVQSEYTEISSFKINGLDSSSAYVTTESYESNSYDYTIPANYLTPSNTNSFKYKFQVRYRNNLFNNNFSKFSVPVEIEFTKPNQSSDSITFTILDSNSNKNNTLKVSWNHPSNGERGVISSQASNGLPKIQKYTFKSIYLKDNDDYRSVDHGTTNINNSSRSSDPSTTKEFTFYDALKYDEVNDSKSIDGGLDIEIKEYNEYVNNNSTFSSAISARATKPSEASNLRNDDINILSSTTENNTTIRWNKPSTTERGLTIRGEAQDNTIIQYDISINRATANKYLLGKIAGGSFTTTNYTTTINNGDTSSDKTSTTEAVTSLYLPSTLSSSNNMFLWPNSTYTFEIKTTNSLGYKTTGVDKSFTTPAPSIPSGLDYFNTSRLQTLYTYGSPDKRTDLNDHSSYYNKGVLTSSDITTSTVYSGSAVQITKLFSSSRPSNITSNIIYHILNKTNFQDTNWNNDNATVVDWTDNNPPSNSNQAQFKIFNSGTGSDVEVYTIGTSSNYATDSGDNKDAIGIDFAISRNTRKDAYKYNSNYDSRNYGYWYMEGVKYSITFTTGASGTVRAEDLYTPLLYKLKSYYNTNGGDTNVSSNSYGTITILKNSANANSYIYLDDSCIANPTISKYNSSDMISYTTNNKINGITNLHLFNSQTATIALTYTASGYSKRYLLTTASNPLQHYFSYSTSTKKAIVNWSGHTSSAPILSGNKYERSQNQWNVNGLSITDFPSRTPATIGITLSITATNTHGSTTKTIDNNSDSTIYNFIMDKPSVDYYNIISSSLREIPSNFNPIYGNSSAQSNTAPSSYVAVGDNTNSLQLSMWNGYFYSNSGWQSTTTITSINCSKYGLLSTLPVFSGNGTDYKYVIFKYEFTPSSTFAPYKVILSLGNSNNFDVSDLDNNVKIFIYTGDSITGADGSSYYWLNMSKFSDITDPAASSGGVVYSGGVADSSYETMSNSNFKSSSDINGVGKFTNNFSGTVPKRIIGARINKISISANTTKSIYIAIGCKNSDSLYLKKPDLYLATGSNDFETEQFS